MLCTTVSRRQHKVKVLYDYEAQDTDEISMNEDEILTVVRIVDDGWIFASTADGKTGMFPRNYCEVRRCTLVQYVGTSD